MAVMYKMSCILNVFFKNKMIHAYVTLRESESEPVFDLLILFLKE